MTHYRVLFFLESLAINTQVAKICRYRLIRILAGCQCMMAMKCYPFFSLYLFTGKIFNNFNSWQCHEFVKILFWDDKLVDLQLVQNLCLFFWSVLNIISTILSLFSPFDKKLAKLRGTLDFSDFIWILDDKLLVWCSDIWNFSIFEKRNVFE